MDNIDQKKYNKIEETLQKINKNFVSLNENDKKNAQLILNHVVS